MSSELSKGVQGLSDGMRDLRDWWVNKIDKATW